MRASLSGCHTLALAAVAAAICLAFAPGPQRGDGAKKESAMLATVEKKDLPIEVEVTDTFQAEDKDRVALEPDEYSGELIIKSLAAEGVLVKKGDLLLEFEADNLKKAIGDSEGEVKDAEVKVKKAQADLESLKIDQDVEQRKVNKELELALQAVQGEDGCLGSGGQSVKVPI